jgi:hypothetical protein
MAGGRSVTTSQRLLSRLRAEGVVPRDAEAEIDRTFASGSQRTEGAWSWSVRWEEGGRHREAGSQWPMADCLREQEWEVSDVLSCGDICIDLPSKDRGRTSSS